MTTKAKKTIPSKQKKLHTFVVIGSYKEDFPGLLRFCQQLQHRGLEVLHPLTTAKMIGEEQGFIKLDIDTSDNEGEIQRYVFSLIDKADAVIVYAPQGAIGTSTAMEIGYTLRAGKSIIATRTPNDITLRCLLASPPAELETLIRSCQLENTNTSD